MWQSWDAFFRNATSGAPPGAAYVSPPSLASSVAKAAPFAATAAETHSVVPAATQDLTISNTKNIDDHLAVQAIIRSYQVSLGFDSLNPNYILV